MSRLDRDGRYQPARRKQEPGPNHLAHPSEALNQVLAEWWVLLSWFIAQLLIARAPTDASHRNYGDYTQ
jgi:hypothetical protein